MSIFDKWNKNVDENFVREVEEADKGNGGNYEKPPYGTYEVKLVKMDVRESKSGDPKLYADFKILSGAEKGNHIYMHQIINTPFPQIHSANMFLRSLDTDVEVKFKDYIQYNDMVLDIMEAIDADKLEYALEYGQNEKGFDTFKITEVFGD